MSGEWFQLSKTQMMNMRTSRLGEQRQSIIKQTEGEGRFGGWGTIRPTQILMSNCPPLSFPLHTLGGRCRLRFLFAWGGGGGCISDL